MHVSMQVCVIPDTGKGVCVRECVRACVCLFVSMFVRLFVGRYACMHTYMHTCVYIHKYIVLITAIFQTLPFLLDPTTCIYASTP